QRQARHDGAERSPVAESVSRGMDAPKPRVPLTYSALSRQASTIAQNSEKSLTTTSVSSGCCSLPCKSMCRQGASHWAPLKNTLVMPARLAEITSVVLSPTYQTLGPGR